MIHVLTRTDLAHPLEHLVLSLQLEGEASPSNKKRQPEEQTAFVISIR